MNTVSEVRQPIEEVWVLPYRGGCEGFLLSVLAYEQVGAVLESNPA